MIQEQITQDLKKALLGGDRETATVLRSLKSAIGYAEVAEGKRETGLADEELIILFQKEAKKRQDSADMYSNAGAQEKAEKELSEKKIIEQYLPAQLSDNEIAKHVDAVIKELGVTDMKFMGQVVAGVKVRTAGAAEGSVIAKITKERLG